MPTVIADIRNNRFAPISIDEGTWVVWRNLDPRAHSAERNREVADYFNAGAMLPGEASSPILFAKAGVYDYLCRFHAGMTGTVHVSPRPAAPTTKSPPDHPVAHQAPPDHPHDHAHDLLRHFHGFVTGGRSAQRLYMTHTPVLADERHHFQIILQASLPNADHAQSYESLRNSSYRDGKVQIFHDHLALQDIGAGQVTELPKSEFRYYPNDPNGVLGETPVPGLEESIPVRIDKVLHFHQFQTDADYPAALTYLLYGDADDTFIDHFINRAPSFHSVARLAQSPDFFRDRPPGSVVKVTIPSKRMFDVSPKILRRVAQVDNAFHVFWLPPPGVYPHPADPLRSRIPDAPHKHAVALPDCLESEIEIGRFLHFDVRLLNYGVLIV